MVTTWAIIRRYYITIIIWNDSSLLALRKNHPLQVHTRRPGGLFHCIWTYGWPLLWQQVSWCIHDGTPQPFPDDHPKWGHCQLGYSTAGESLITVTAPLDPRCNGVCLVVCLGSGYTNSLLQVAGTASHVFSTWSWHAEMAAFHLPSSIPTY